MAFRRYRNRRDTGSAWSAKNPVLASGEIGLDLTTGAFKFGDGTTAWDSLEYYNTSRQVLIGSIDGTVAVGVGTKRFPITATGDLKVVSVTMDTAPTIEDVIVDVNLNGSSVFTIQGDRPTVTVGTYEATAVPNVTSVTSGDYLTVDIDQASDGANFVIVIEVECY